MARLLLEVEADDRAGPVLARIASQIQQIPALVDRFGREIKNSSDEANRNLRAISDETRKGAQSMGVLSSAANDLKGILIGFFGVQAVIRGFGTALREALEEEAALRRLSVALGAAGISFDQNRGRIEEWASELQRTTLFTDEQFVGALAKATTRLGDLGESQKLVALAARVAAATGRDLGSATEFLAESLFTGQRGVLTLRREFGDLVKGANSSADALNLLNARLPATASQAKGGEAALNRLGKGVRDLAEDIGKQLLVSLDFLSRVTFPDSSSSARETGSAIDSLRERLKELGAQQRALLPRVGIDPAAGGKLKEVEEEQKKVSQALAAETKKRGDARRAAAKRDKDFTNRIDEEASAETLAQLDRADKAKRERERQGLEQAEALVKRQTETLKTEDEKAREFKIQRLELEGRSDEAATERQRLESEKRIEDLRARHEEAGLLDFEQTEAFKQAQELTRIESQRTAAESSIAFQAISKTGEAVANRISTGFAKSFADSILEGKDFEDSMTEVFESILRTAIETFVQIAVARAITFAVGGFFAQHGSVRVPGPVGRPVPVTLHGGETVTTSAGTRQPGGGRVDVRIPGPVGRPVPAVLRGGDIVTPAGGVPPTDQDTSELLSASAVASPAMAVSAVAHTASTTLPLTMGPGVAGALAASQIPMTPGTPGAPMMGSLTINMNLHVADLNPAERSRVVASLVEEIRRATVQAREFAGELATLTARQAGSVV